MDELISVRVLARLAGSRETELQSWREFVDVVGEGTEYWSLVGQISSLIRSLPKPQPSALSQKHWLKETLLRLERELDEWLRDPFAPLDYFVSLLADKGSAEEERDWHWSAAMSARARLSEAPLGVRVLPLAADSLQELLQHLNRGFLHDIETFRSDDVWIDAFLTRVNALERWLGIDLESRLDEASLTPYLRLKRQKGWRELTLEAIKSLPSRVPEQLKSTLIAFVQQYSEPMQVHPGPPPDYLVPRASSLAFTHYKTPHESVWW